MEYCFCKFIHKNRYVGWHGGEVRTNGIGLKDEGKIKFKF